MWRPERRPPDLAEFDRMVRDAFEALPDPFRTNASDVYIHVQDFAAREILQDLEIDSPFGLLGLYQGVDLTRASVNDPFPQPARVTLYREPILRLWSEGGQSLKHIVTHVLVHEIGHHFGLSDEDMDAIENEVD